MVSYSYCVAMLLFVTSFALPAYASQERDSEENDSEKQAFKRTVQDTERGEARKRQKLELIEELKQKRREAEKGERPWVDLLKEEKRAIAKKIVTESDLGIQSNTSFLSPRKILGLPIEEQYDAILKVRPDDLQFIPERMRKTALKHHLEVIGRDVSDEEMHTLRARLGLITFSYTYSQEMVLSIELPKIDDKLKPLKAQLGQILKIKSILESEQKRLTKQEDKSPKDMEALEKISERLKEFAQSEKEIESKRSGLAKEQKGPIRKVMREYFGPRPVIRVSSELDEISKAVEDSKADE